MWCCSSFGLKERVPANRTLKMQLGLSRDIRWKAGLPEAIRIICAPGPERARAAVRIAARRPEFPGPLLRPVTKCENAKTAITRILPRPSLESWTNLRSPRARAARRVGADARREARICAPEKGLRAPREIPESPPPPPAPRHPSAHPPDSTGAFAARRSRRQRRA
eukprot:gene12400-biopygen19948